MEVLIKPNEFTSISTGSCTISGSSQTELVRFYEGDTFIVESYLNTPITILSNVGIKAKTVSRDINITVDLAGELVTSKLFSNGLSLKDIINSNITTPSISSVIDYLLKGGGESAIAYAMTELGYGAIDWVLDPANNRVKYKDSSAGGTTAPPGYHYVYTMNGVGTSFSSLKAACSAYNVYQGTTDNPYKCTESTSQGSSPIILHYPDGTRIGDYGYRSKVADSDDNPAPAPEWKYIPIDTVAAKVIANAEAGHGPSQEAVNNSVKI